VPLFRRGRDQAAEDQTQAAVDVPGPETPAEDATFVDAPVEDEEQEETFSRADGPWDVTEAPEVTEPRLDLGSLQLTGYPGLELRIEVDQESESVISASAVLETAALQVQVFAAPRSGGLWREVRKELAASIIESGGTAEESDGTFGRELRAEVPVDGSQPPARQAVRFVGVDGPRWFLRGVFTGTAYESGAEPQLEAVLRGCVVVRGDEAMAPKGPLPLRLPEEAVTTEAPEGPLPLEPFKRGPEITEIH
jgi:hypothetical protein